MGRGFLVIVCTVVLSGCALPVPFQIASWALDGISYLATDKTIADHGISMVAQKDCALWRGLKGEEICSETDEVGIFAIASADTPVMEDQQAVKLSVPEEVEVDAAALANFETAAGSPEIAPAVVVSPEPNSKNGERLMIVGKQVWTERMDADLYYVIGSFSKRDNARRMISKYPDLGPAVMASRLDGVEVYRVAVGPFTIDQKRQMRLRLKLVGIDNAWAMRIDHRDWTLASPKELSVPSQSVAEGPQGTQPGTTVKPVPGIITSDEIAETPGVPGKEPGQSSELINSGKHHLVIGSFSNAENASNFAKTKAAFSPRVLSADTAAGWRHRVVIGPYAKAESLAVRRALASAGIDHIWALNLVPEGVTDETLLADVLDAPYLADKAADKAHAVEIAETLAPQHQQDVSKMEGPSASLDQEMGWGVNLVEYIFDMFRASKTTDVVGVVPPLES